MVEDRKIYLKDAVLPQGTVINILVNGNPITIAGFEDTVFPVTVPTGKECVAFVKFVIRDPEE